MFLLLTGKWPFRAESLTNLMYNIANEPHPDIAAMGFELPAMAEVKAVIDRALQKDPLERFENGAQFAAAVRDCIAKMSIDDHGPAALDRAVS
jgi:serine/threonine-protein kinase